MTVSLSEQIKDRYLRVLDQINRATQTTGRPSQAVRLIVVTKTHPVERILAAFESGINLFGENYAEEAVLKMAELSSQTIEWHMIGHIQSRKANLVAGNFALVHSLDSLKLAQRLNRFAEAAGKIQSVLLEVNVADEKSKFGYSAATKEDMNFLISEVEQILQLSSIKLCGLMTMPPYFEQGEKSRPYFKKLNLLRDELAKRFPAVAWNELSMGTSVDYVTAVEEGATLVRVGTAIMGSRPAGGEPA